MTNVLSCRACGAQAGPGSSVSGLCPACLLDEVLNGDGDPPLSAEFRRFGLAAGSNVGPFRIDRLLGKGGMAAVYEAHEGPPLERTVALKVLPPEFLHEESFARRFVNEARIIASLEHPGIVPIYASGIEDGVPWISMRLLTGGTLSELLERGPLGVERTVKVLADVAGALDYAHKRGVIHRDIKPSNILIDEAGRAYVGDFGLARLVEPLEHVTRSGTIVGTPQYMAPEQGQHGSINERCDTYSLGIVAYEMLTGSPPFTGESPIAVMTQHANAPVPAALRQKCPEPVYLAVEKALAKNPDERWESSAAFVNALSQGVAAHPLRSGPTLAAIAAGLAIVLATTGAFWWTRAGEVQVDVVARATLPPPPPIKLPAPPEPVLPPVVVADPVAQGGAPTPSNLQSSSDGSTTRKADDSPDVPVGDEPPAEPSTTNVAVVTQSVIDKSEGEEKPPTAPPPSPPVAEMIPPRLQTMVRATADPILTSAARVGAAPLRVVVTLEGTVGSDGRVSEIQLVDDIPDKPYKWTDRDRDVRRRFVAAATDAFKQYRYTPAQRNGKPVPYPKQRERIAVVP